MRPIRPNPRAASPPRGSLLLLAILVLALTGCHTTVPPALPRAFQFQSDTFAYANELLWEYEFDENSNQWWHRPREPRPDYTHHCFVVAKAARQFFQFATFDPTQPRVCPETYRRLVRKVVSRDPARPLPDADRVVIPGYADLREFSRAHETLLKQTCGPAWRSYFQRGHWRMVFPISRGHQEKTAAALCAALDANRPPVVHLVAFPSLRINHAAVVLAYKGTPEGIVFHVYDPNDPKEPAPLTYHAERRTFSFPRNPYFKGGDINIYEIYRSLFY